MSVDRVKDAGIELEVRLKVMPSIGVVRGAETTLLTTVNSCLYTSQGVAYCNPHMYMDSRLSATLQPMGFNSIKFATLNVLVS